MEFVDNSTYVNHDQRNVHVWCSQLRRGEIRESPRFGRAALGLIAGCYTDNNLPIRVFYDWLKIIVSLGNQDMPLIRLVPISDPSGLTIPDNAFHLPLYPQGASAIEQNSSRILWPGHYMMVLLHPKNRDERLPLWPALNRTSFPKRIKTVTQTNTPQSASSGGVSSPNASISRNLVTRRIVRMRDKKCLVTGQPAFRRNRGGNFSGLEVAHIFPLMGASGPGPFKDTLPAQLHYKVATRQLADQPHNAILLRADVHAQFDDYQWSVMEMNDHMVIVRFEKDGAPGVINRPHLQLGHTQLLSSTGKPDSDLLKHHCKIAVLWHVRGFGKEPSRDYKSLVW